MKRKGALVSGVNARRDTVNAEKREKDVGASASVLVVKIKKILLLNNRKLSEN
jgi:hypothetical protein